MSFENRSSALDSTSGGATAATEVTAVILCKTGCGFYGSAAFDGMCSKCYKDKIKQQQQEIENAQQTIKRVEQENKDDEDTNSSEKTDSADKAEELDVKISEKGGQSNVIKEEREEIPSLETGTPTVLSTKTSSNDDQPIAATPEASGSTPDTSAADSPSSSTSSGKEKPKRNRCLTCKKKVGLTGFECRCGGLYCSIHRYSDMHDCNFDYKEHGQEQIRKNNPIVVGKKVQKL